MIRHPRLRLGIVAVLAVGAIVALTAVALLALRTDNNDLAAIAHDPAQIALGGSLYSQHCAICHGVNLEGQPNWRTRKPDGRLPAPPHDESGHTWHHPDADLFQITKLGLVPPLAPESYQSDMPGFAAVLTDGEIRAVLAFIENSWPPDIRDRRTRRN